MKNHHLVDTNLDQSLFARFIRLGFRDVELTEQACSRPSLRELYASSYPDLTDLNPERFKIANAGFAFDYQFIDVQAFQQFKEETQPKPNVWQNVGEAEYVVAVFQYMRLIGYPANQISILALYQGQVQLIHDVLKQRCEWNPFFGKPKFVGTVDAHQGSQSDFVLLSLVRTKSLGFLNSSRVTSIFSSAKLGLYVFGRKSLFEKSTVMERAFKFLSTRPFKLSIVDDKFPTDRLLEDTAEMHEFEGVDEFGKFVYDKTVEYVQAQSMMDT